MPLYTYPTRSTWKMQFELRDSANNLIDMSGGKQWFMLKADPDDADADAVVSLTEADAEITLPALGKVKIEVTPDNATAKKNTLVAPDEYHLIVKVRTSGGLVVTKKDTFSATKPGIDPYA